MKVVLTVALLTLPCSAGTSAVADLTRAGQWEPSQWPAFQAMLGHPAPKLELSRWALGSLPPSGWKGKIVVVDFWATWCGPCRQAIPHNNAITAKYMSRGVVLLGACTGGREDTMEAVAKAAGGAYPTAVAGPGTAADWKLRFFPTYAVIDRNGVLRSIGIQPDYVEKVLDALLAEQPH